MTGDSCFLGFSESSGIFVGSQRIRGERWVYKGMFIGTRELWFRVSSDPVKGHCMHVYHSLQSLKSFPSLANKSTGWWVVGTKIALHQRPPPPCCVGRLRRNSGGNANQLRQGLQIEGITCTLWQESISTECDLVWCETTNGWGLSKPVSYLNVFLPSSVWSGAALALVQK